ncbi:MAG: hypothetical protein ACREI9_14520 [Nitrospiraceae bacterium]
MKANIRYKDSRAIVDELLPGLSRAEAELVASLPDQFHLANIQYIEGYSAGRVEVQGDYG